MSESPIITFVRAVTLLAVLIALPGMAICWNHLPDDFWSEPAPSTMRTKIKATQYLRKNSEKSQQTVSVFAPESIYPALPDPPVLPEIQEGGPVRSLQGYTNTAARQVSREHFNFESSQDVESLIIRLKALGTTYYQLQPWGNQGELFRISCLVAPSESYSYKKYFHAIDSDVVTVMEKVIADIEKWQNIR